MTEMTAAYLPHLGAALVVACALLAMTSRLNLSDRGRQVLFGSVMAACLVPLPEFSATHYLRVITGDLSVTGFIVLGLAAVTGMTGRDYWQGAKLPVSLALVLCAMLLYPTSLGLTYFDLYAHGYYPIVLGPVLFSIFAWLIWFRHLLPAVILAACFVAYVPGLLESDNLWDYLVDSVVVVYAAAIVLGQRKHISRPAAQQVHVEVFLCLTAATFLAFAVYLAKANPDAFRHEFVIEDGFVEWCTVIVLIVAMIVCWRRFWQLRGRRSPLFLGVTVLLALFCLFGAGEEISWGQRIFGLETPEYLLDRNAQGELGLHNLVVEINGEEVKLNKLIFGTGLAVALLIYLFVATPLYRTKAPVTRFFHAIAAPMPRNYQVAGYLVVVAVVELLVDSSKRGEMTEFAGSIVFALNVIYPYNPQIFDPEVPLQD